MVMINEYQGKSQFLCNYLTNILLNFFTNNFVYCLIYLTFTFV